MSRYERYGAKGLRGRSVSWGLVFALTAVLPGCEKADTTLPRADEVQGAYTYQGDLEVRMSGNVAEITIAQPPNQLERGGSLWAKVGPYVLLFSRETETLFQDYPGLAGIRVITTSGGAEVARALLPRESLNDVTWRKALNIAGLARRDGTQRPALLEDLVEWGEEHTEFEYNPRFTRT